VAVVLLSAIPDSVWITFFREHVRYSVFEAEPKDGAAENEGHRPAEGLLTKNAIEDELFA